MKKRKRTRQSHAAQATDKPPVQHNLFRLSLMTAAAALALAAFYQWRVSNAKAGRAAVPMVTVNKTAALAPGGDVNGNGFVNPGDKLAYSVTVNNTGTEAMNVVFTDQLDPNLTLEAGSVIASPIGTNDSYVCLGNVGITVPDGVNDLLGNDVSPDATAISVTAVNTAGTQGQVSFNANGSFTFLPNAGFEGMTTFSYTVTSTNGKSDTGTVTINVNEVIWFVDNSGSNGDGRLGTPFNSIANFNAGAADETGDIIFIYRQAAGDYTGSALTLLADQKLIGQGSSATLATSFTPNLSVPSFSNPLPVTGGTRPTLTNTATNVTLNTGNTIRGVNIQSTTAGSAIQGTSFNNLTVSETTVAATNATAAVDLNQASGTAAINASFIGVAANNCANGIVLADTTGSFTVTGTGTAASGGTIQNGAIGVSLSNAQNVSLSRMQLNDFSDFAIRGSSVVNFTLADTTISGTNGTDAGADEGSVRFTGLTGTATISNCAVSGAVENNFTVVNTSGTLNRVTFTGVTFGAMSAATGDDALLLESQSNAVINATVQNCFFTAARGDHFQLNLVGSQPADLVFTGNTISNTGVTAVSGGGGIRLVGGNNTGSNNAAATFNIANNTMRDSRGTALAVNKLGGTGTFSGAIASNTIGVAAVSNSGSAEGSGIFVLTDGGGTYTASITGNTVRQYGNYGIFMQTGGSGVMGSGAMNLTVTGNTVTNPGTLVFAKNGMHLNAGVTAGDAYQACLGLGGAGALANSITGTGTDGGTDFRLRQRQSTTVRLPGYGGANNDDAAVVSFVRGNNGGMPSGSVTNTVPTGGGFVGGAACAMPSTFALIETDEPANTSGKQAEAGFLTRVWQWVASFFSA